MEKIKVGIVNYLNTLPLLRGIEASPVLAEIELSGAYPSKLAEALIRKEIDLGLVPVAVIPQVPDARIVSNYGIAADGPVASVCLFSDCPLEEIDTVLLDYQSRTSVALTRILFAEYWRLPVRFEAASGEFHELIKGKTAGVLIGDRCLSFRSQARFIYDLSEAWKAFTGFPFVFAAWVSNRELPEAFCQAFDAANAAGLQLIPEIVQQHPLADYDLLEYYTKNIQYLLDEPKKKGLALFLEKLKQIPQL